ncbi:MAG: nickel pincer cofactor biosynthesis protein LarC [Clostridiales bacterium]|nr:nickel pincer cofactor biosynthesis protein LarC [Clostridiales bacterium]
MRTLYLECAMGAAGDMLTAALLSLVDDVPGFVAGLNALGLPGVSIEAAEKEQYGITGLHMHVRINGEEEHEHFHKHVHEHDHENEKHHHQEHEHFDMDSIRAIIDALPVSDKVKSDIHEVYTIIANAEAKVHGKPVELVHFHEVGAMDAVADVAAVCLLMERLGADKICASPVHLGSGTVRCAHGVLPVPTPATAEILKGVPCYGGDVSGELCTPTGAALLKHFAGEYGPMPVMRVEKIGVGIGTKDFGRCNCLRAFIGETESSSDTVLQLSCNVDDMTGEALGYAMEKLFEAGAADAFFTPIYMKKNRPAYMLTCICPEAKEEDVTRAIFRHTSTLGLRRTVCRRSVLERKEYTAVTSLGNVRVKCSEGYGVKRVKPEFDDVKKIAGEKDLGVAEVYERLAREINNG